MHPSQTRDLSLRRRVVLLVLFGVVFGYVEAAAVVYVRVMYEPIHQRVFPERAPDDLFPLFSQEQWAREGPAYLQRPWVEVGRELGTVLLVVLLAGAVSRTFRDGFAAFMLAFGVWDLAYYLWLWLLIGWPHSLGEWDLIFAAPVPWVGPVLAPLLVAAAMTLTAAVYFRCAAVGRAMVPRRGHWVAVALGALGIMFAFWWDCRNTLAGGAPQPFQWPLLLLGLAVGLAGYVHALVTSREPAAATLPPAG
jgi:hypothetical protein